MRLRSALACLVAMSACAELPTAPAEPLQPDAPADGVLIYLTTSSPGAAPGERVSVAINALRAASAEAVGSFTLRVAYDTTALRLVASDGSREGMVLANGVGGVVTIAGASGDGFRAGPLATLTMEVVRAGGLPSLAVTVAEMNATSFQDQRAMTSVDRRQYASPLAP